MVVRTTDKIPEYYDEGFLPWPWPEDEVPERLPIDMKQSESIKYLIFALSRYFRGRLKNLFMDTNIPIRYDPGNRRVFIAPDICVSFDVDMLAIRDTDSDSYDMWEMGKPPEFVLEVASPSTYRKDLYEKPDIYAYLGVDEYWMFDPRGGELYGQALAGYRLVDGRYEPIETTPNEQGFDSGYSDALGIRLCAVERSRQDEILTVQPDFVFMQEHYNAAFYALLQDTETGLYILNEYGFMRQHSLAETRADTAEARADTAQARADTAEAQANTAQARADTAEARADRAEGELEAALEEIARLREQSR